MLGWLIIKTALFYYIANSPYRSNKNEHMTLTGSTRTRRITPRKKIGGRKKEQIEQ